MKNTNLQEATKNTINGKYLDKYWVGQKVRLGFFVRAYGKIRTNFLANPI